MAERIFKAELITASLIDDDCVLTIRLDDGTEERVEYLQPIALIKQLLTVLNCKAIDLEMRRLESIEGNSK